jgi:hypothetical protein
MANIERIIDGAAIKGIACPEEATAGVLLVVLWVAAERISSGAVIIIAKVATEESTTTGVLLV